MTDSNAPQNTLIKGRIKVSNTDGTEVFCQVLETDLSFNLPYGSIGFYFIGLTKKQVVRCYDLLQNQYEVVIDTNTWKLFIPDGLKVGSGVDLKLPEPTGISREVAKSFASIDKVNDMADDYIEKHLLVRPIGM